MNKSLLIIKREYLTRIRKKTFLVSTILFPVFYLAIIFGSTYIAKKNSKVLRVAVLDSSGVFDRGLIGRANLQDSSSYLDFVTADADSVRQHFSAMGYDGYVVVPPSAKDGLKSLTLVTEKNHGITSVYGVQNKLNTIWTNVNYNKLGITEQQRSLIEQSKINLTEKNINDEKADSGIASGIGYVAAILIYIILLLYGSQVMMGVMEEKTSRIAEVMVSSIRPFQLMLGKIIGIGLVALTQFLLWIVFALVIYNVTKASGSSNAVSEAVGQVNKVISNVNVPFILVCFVFYLLGGFFFYASLFAAIGSSVNEDMREAQSLSFPITMIVVFSVMLMAPVIADPSGKLAFWASIIPFSSPIIMMCRIPFGIPGTVPWWQLGLSAALLIAGFLFTTWFAGKIYRTGILMYGKKPSWKEMLKWASRK
ncbi:ABC transporter permease [Flavisolibacter ginsenosidimutans]|uniref:ABC transporter permease n=1 Tax=Flavisolibacter ginsenosidimutans TaxID=661481 RepID=A0A5B8UK30_9BACT|nr:ABC transporter permease [Flavisolibacter ginsenosidimutans]QEC56400.1 ABC transporter permease [Flavisolibacter ginsenosidimutans]